MLDASNIIIWTLALALVAGALRRPGNPVKAASFKAAQSFFAVLPRFALAVLTAGFVGQLLPGDVIAAQIGEDSGVRGILLASILGGFVPGGPIISFPIVVVLSEAGAGLPQLIAFLTAWSALAFHRVLLYESTLMGWRFSATRIASSLVLAPLAGLASALLLDVLPAWG